MKTRLIYPRVIIFLYTIILFHGCTSNISKPDLKNKNIICFGNSITEGVGSDVGEDFPSLLAKKLNRPVMNAGKGGDTTRSALERLKADVLEKNPGLVIVELGGNDYLQKIPREETFKNLEKIITDIQQEDAVVVLAAVKIGVLFDEYYSGFKTVAQKKKILLIPDIMQDVFINPKFKSDSIHPNAAGYQMIAEKIYRYIVPSVKDKNWFGQ